MNATTAGVMCEQLPRWHHCFVNMSASQLISHIYNYAHMHTHTRLIRPLRTEREVKSNIKSELQKSSLRHVGCLLKFAERQETVP